MKPTRIGLNSLCLLCFAFQFIVIQSSAIAGNKGNPVVDEVAQIATDNGISLGKNEIGMLEMVNESARLTNNWQEVENGGNDPLSDLVKVLPATDFSRFQVGGEMEVLEGLLISIDENGFGSNAVRTTGKLPVGTYLVITNTTIWFGGEDTESFEPGRLIEFYSEQAERAPGTTPIIRTCSTLCPGGGSGSNACCYTTADGSAKCRCVANRDLALCVDGGGSGSGGCSIGMSIPGSPNIQPNTGQFPSTRE